MYNFAMQVLCIFEQVVLSKSHLTLLSNLTVLVVKVIDKKSQEYQKYTVDIYFLWPHDNFFHIYCCCTG